MTTVITGPAGLHAHVGQELGVSSWHPVRQEDVDRFADLTGDHQWIHVDPARAKDSPFGGTIAHGYFTLALTPMLHEEIFAFEGFAFGLNYGLDRLRFPSPMPTGGRVRASVRLTEVVEVGGGGLQVELLTTFEREGGDKPVCVAAMLVRLYPSPEESADAA